LEFKKTRLIDNMFTRRDAGNLPQGREHQSLPSTSDNFFRTPLKARTEIMTHL
jgi:hypothetical protein